MAVPNITEWISSIGTLLGIPAAAWGIITLFRKNKDQERKLESLESLAKAQSDVAIKMNEQIEELARHTSEFQYQSELMKEANEITRISLDIQIKNQIHSQETESERLDLQKLERLSNIKPHFTFSGASSSPSEGFAVKLLNKGNTAKNIEITQIDNELANITPLETGNEYDRNTKLVIKGYADPTRTYYNSNQVPFDVEIKYEDIDGNDYKQVLSRKNNKFKLTNPERLIISEE
jgi:hypothetical protein